MYTKFLIYIKVHIQKSIGTVKLQCIHSNLRIPEIVFTSLLVPKTSLIAIEIKWGGGRGNKMKKSV